MEVTILSHQRETTLIFSHCEVQSNSFVCTYTASSLTHSEIDCLLLQMNQQCKVCGEPAAGFHFGAFTCEGCK
ncbi:hypothetical protein DBV15_10966, partial [Temnothorax longispinosus]